MYQPIANECEFPDVDLNEYPVRANPHLNQTVTVGDMHGNGMKLLWILCHLGVLELLHSQTDWDRLWDIYRLPVTELNRELLDEFKTILSKSEKGARFPAQIIFIGDLLADRGENDYFTALIFEKIHPLVPYKILMSNHDFHVFVYFENPEALKMIHTVRGKDYKRSFINFLKLCERIPELRENFYSMMLHFIVPHMTLFSYEKRREGQYVLFSHAVFNLNHIRCFLNDRSLEETFQTPESFFQFINAINHRFFQWMYARVLHRMDSYLYKMLWEREPNLATLAFLRNLNMINVHGHVTTPVVERYRISIDTPLGRAAYTEKNGDEIPEFSQGILGLYNNPFCLQSTSPLPCLLFFLHQAEGIEFNIESTTENKPKEAIQSLSENQGDITLSEPPRTPSREPLSPLTSIGFFQQNASTEESDDPDPEKKRYKMPEA